MAKQIENYGFNLKKNIYLLVAIILFLSVSIVIFLNWQSDRESRMRNLESKYHLNTINYCAKVNKELYLIEKHLLDKNNFLKHKNAHVKRNQSIKHYLSGDKINISYNLIGRHIKHITKVHSIYKQEEFTHTTKRMEGLYLI